MNFNKLTKREFELATIADLREWVDRLVKKYLGAPPEKLKGAARIHIDVEKCQ